MSIPRYGYHAEDDDQTTYLLQEIGNQCERIHDAAKGLETVLNELFQNDESHYDLEGVMTELVEARAETLKGYFTEFERLVGELKSLEASDE